MPKVSVISTLPPLKGLSAYTTEFCRAMGRLWEVDFIGFRRLYPERLYPGGTVDPAARPIEIEGVFQRPLLSWNNPLSWLRAGWTLEGDLVHGQWWSYVLAPVYLVVLLIARMRGRPVVLTVHNVLPHEEGIWRRIMNRSVIGLADAVIVHSEQNRATLLSRHGFKAENVHVIPHGVLSPAGPVPSRSEARKILDLTEEDRAVLFFGNIRDYKGLDTLIRAFKAIDVPGKRLFIVGQCWEDRRLYDRLIDGDPTIVFQEGFVPMERAAVYAAASDLMVLPYRRFDSASGVGGFALHFQVPLIVSDVGSLPDLVPDRACCLIQPDDVEDLSGKMARILLDDGLRARLREGFAEKAREFGWESIALKTADVYSSLMARRPR